MSSIVTNNSDQIQEASKITKRAPVTQKGPGALVLAWIYLVESINTQQESARIQAKILRLNSETQQELNNEIGAIMNVEIPTLQQKHETKHGQKVTVNENEAQVAAAQTANQEAAKQRQQLENIVIVLRQTYQTNATSVNTEINNMLQSVSEGTEMVKILKKVSLKILNKQNLK